MYTTRPARRPGMTLIEILVVIAIIGILASLALVGVMAVMGRGPETVTRGDIEQLSVSLARFKADYGIYPPSKIRLCSNRSQYNPGVIPPTAASKLDADSVMALSKVWKSLGNWTNISWDGSATPNQSWILEGDQCLVFFLNGVSSDPANPMNPLADKKVYYQFDTKRLMQLNPASPAFLSYLDGFNTVDASQRRPYVYFSSGTRDNGYDLNHVTRFGVAPYYSAPGKYYNATTFQIISSGVNQQFGPGMLWPPTNAAGMDDFSNFHDKKLGN